MDRSISERHNRYEELGSLIGKKVVRKNKAYGDAITLVPKIVKILFPEGIPYEKIDIALLIIRDLDKTVRLALGDESLFEESPFGDKAGYGILGEELMERLRGGESNE